ncbi:SDR family NAD(P)-dependent oxidoreductase [Derxia gummosa]|uniref:SDR family NAD(P)-dependent oxidoreductase n=1 Tax=Derxia gummosa DSM 723 TaxID=1121388 RepID=A0A8B6X4I7_9BURK|nr:SDR family NAD(P)-dependent oxidoreductase [Derxia gummosa]
MSEVAIVTGASQGLGRAIAAALLGAGYRVAVTDRDLGLAEDAAQALGGDADRLLPLALDVADKAAFEAARDAVLARWGRLEVAVGNAAVTLTTPVMRITPEEFDLVIRVNLRGCLFGGQVFGAHMARAGYGRLINIASLAGQNGGTASGAHYAASKAGILNMTKVFARELAPSGVTVNAIAPGPLDLPSVRAAVPPERLQTLVDTLIPVRQLGDADFVAATVVHLASRAAGFVTGAAWDINGGVFMR